MQHLVEHRHPFRRETFGDSRELLHQLARNGEAPPVLLITCPDAGLLAEHLAPQSVASIHCASALGAFVPAATAADSGDADSIATAIEFALPTTGGGHIVVCGHSPCCALSTLLGRAHPATRSPQLDWWRKETAPLRRLVQAHYAYLPTDAARHKAAEQESVLLSLENLPGYPCVRERLSRGPLQLHGWFFHRPSGQLFAYAAATGHFEPLMMLAQGRRT